MATMEKRDYTPYLAVIALLSITSLALAFAVDATVSDQAGVRSDLPSHVGDWTGMSVLYCQERTCHRQVLQTELTKPDTCPTCGGKVASMSLVEASILPSDTVLVRKIYTNTAGRVLIASIVLSGRERASIHRPETCLAGEGTEIVNQSILPIPLEGRAPLRVKLLDLINRQVGPGASPRTAKSFYAYWFVGRGRETPEHWQRMWWMASDRILHNVAHRWAYIAVSGRADDAEDYLREMEAFVQRLYPQMALSDSATSAAAR